jgi:hypothetical protein
MIDYLLLAGFAAAGGYTIWRLFVGLLNSSAAPARTDVSEDPDQAADASRQPGPVTHAPWQSRNTEKEESRE